MIIWGRNLISKWHAVDFQPTDGDGQKRWSVCGQHIGQRVKAMPAMFGEKMLKREPDRVCGNCKRIVEKTK